MRIPRWLIAVGVVLAGAGGGLYWLMLPPESLTVVSWGEDYGRAQMLALFHPYTDNIGRRRRGHELWRRAEGDRPAGRIARRTSGTWSISSWRTPPRAAAQGLLERLDDIELPPGLDGVGGASRFRARRARPVLGREHGLQPGDRLRSGALRREPAADALADFFDLARFPGPRGLRDSGPKYNLELALIADGVPPWRVYPALATTNGVDRAFAKLDSDQVRRSSGGGA